MTATTMRRLARLICLLAMAAGPALAHAAGGAEPAAAAASASAASASAPAASPESASATAAASVPFTLAERPPLPAPIVSPAAAAPAPTASFMQTMFGLVLVLGVLLGLAWAIKRFGPRQLHGNARVKLVGALSLGGRERILVVEVGEQWIVVGAAPGQVNALSVMPRQEIEGGLESSPASASFADWLKQTVEKRNERRT
jgi:flagellar protein FliO/FliZ